MWNSWWICIFIFHVSFLSSTSPYIATAVVVCIRRALVARARIASHFIFVTWISMIDREKHFSTLFSVDFCFSSHSFIQRTVSICYQQQIFNMLVCSLVFVCRFWTQGIFKGYFELFTTKYTIFPFFYFWLVLFFSNLNFSPVHFSSCRPATFRVQSVVYNVLILYAAQRGQSWRIS